MNSFNARTALKVLDQTYEIYNPDNLPGGKRLPYAKKILLENLLRHEDGENITRSDIETFLKNDSKTNQEIAFRPARVLMQDFTGVPVVADLAVMRDTMRKFGKSPDKINPSQPVDLIVDHSVQVDRFANADACDINTKLEYQRNGERYSFLKWAQKSFSNFNVIPPGSGIVHQINIESIARLVFTAKHNGTVQAYPDTLVGTDSHTTMVNGIGVLGWGVGGIEAEASMLGQSISMLTPKVVCMRLDGRLQPGITATDLVLTVVQMLRQHGVVGKFVEFRGSGLEYLSVGDRATIANMAPEYGATCGLFPIDAHTLDYLRLTGREDKQVALVEAYAQTTGLWANENEPDYDEQLTLDLGSVEPCLAGPRRPQDKVLLKDVKSSYNEQLTQYKKNPQAMTGEQIGDGAVVIAAITSCTNTSNPSVMIAAGLVARNAAQLGLKVKPWVKTSLAPGSRVVTRYLEDLNLTQPLQELGFHTVGYGCTTCIGNSGPLPEDVSKAIEDQDLVAVAVLSGNRNFEGRVHAQVRMNYLASPPLVVAYALSGRIDINMTDEPLGTDTAGQPVFLKDIWPSHEEIRAMEGRLSRNQFDDVYTTIYEGDQNWQNMRSDEGELYDWPPKSSYVVAPPYFEGMAAAPGEIDDIRGARVIGLFGDSITTDHISPAGAIAEDSPAGHYLKQQGVSPAEFNSYGSRRGNHEIMMRGTFANIRLHNHLAPESRKGGQTTHIPSGKCMAIYDAAQRYKEETTPVIVIAGKEYGSGSSRDWAAKGPLLLGVRAVIVESYERIHRSNLVGMGVLPLQFIDGENAASLKLSGKETYDISGIADPMPDVLEVTATGESGKKTFKVKVRIDTPREQSYYRHGGILPYVMRRFINEP